MTRILDKNNSSVKIHIDKDVETLEKLNILTQNISSNDLDNW